MKNPLPHLATTRRAAVALTLLTGLAPAARAQTIIQNFAGLSLDDTSGPAGGAYAPPDTMGAIGPSAFVEFINGGYAVYDKTTAARTAFTTDTAFWTAAGISNTLTAPGLSDTRVKFDPASNRWFASEINVAATGNSVLLAVSKTNNPLDGWLGTSYTAVNGTTFGDYPTLGVDANAVYIGTNNFSSAGAFTGVTISSIPKSSLLTATPTTTGKVTSTQNSTGPSRGYTLQGVTNTGTGYTTGAVLAVSATAYNQVKLTTVNTPAGTATFGTPSTISGVLDGDTTQVHQPDGSRTVDGLDTRFSSTVVQVGSRIFAVIPFLTFDPA